MAPPMTVQKLIASKSKGVYTTTPDTTVFEAVQTMVAHDVGALVVHTDGTVHGIITERDYMRKMVLQGRDPHTTPVRDIMTANVIYVTPEQTVDDCMAIMNDKQIRHLPVINGDNELKGLVSIRDVVRDLVADKEFMIDQLITYITDRPNHLRPTPPPTAGLAR